MSPSNAASLYERLMAEQRAEREEQQWLASLSPAERVFVDHAAAILDRLYFGTPRVSQVIGR